MNTREGYGEFIRHHRIKSGYKRQNQLAEVSGISEVTISRIENEIRKPEVSTLQILSNFLTSTTYEELMGICRCSFNEIEYNKSNELTDR